MRLQPLLQGLRLGPLVRHENLTFAPLVGSDALSSDLLLPDEAFETGYFTVAESGSIQTLFVDNRLGVPVLIPSGSTFEGETQNRAAVFSVLIAPRSQRVPLLVRCVEQGQPLRAGVRFHGSGAILVPSARTGEVSQHDVWGTISFTVGGHHPTHDYSAGLAAADVSEYLAAVGPPAAGQRGYVAAVRETAGVSFYADILGSRGLYARLHEKLGRGLAALARVSPPARDVAEVGGSELLKFLREAGQVELEKRALRSGLMGIVCVGRGVADVSALVHRGVPIQASFRREPARPHPRGLDDTLFVGPKDLERLQERLGLKE